MNKRARLARKIRLWLGEDKKLIIFPYDFILSGMFL
jgi:hypothetical protein